MSVTSMFRVSTSQRRLSQWWRFVPTRCGGDIRGSVLRAPASLLADLSVFEEETLMLPKIKGTLLPAPPFPDFSYDEVLGYYDGPRILLERDELGQLYLVWWSDADMEMERWVCLPLTEARLHAIFAGQVSPRDAMENPEGGYLLAIEFDLTTDAAPWAIKTTAAAFPQNALPHPEARLNVPMPNVQESDTPTLKVAMRVGNPDGGELLPVSAVVDAEAPHSMLPASLLAGLDIEPLEELGCILTDGSKARYGFGIARFSIGEKERPCPVIFGPEGKYLLGNTTLGIFNLAVDQAGKCLIPKQTLSLGWGGSEKPSKKSTGQSILEMFDALHQSMPEGAFDDFPTDGAANLKHYLYGWPKEGER